MTPFEAYKLYIAIKQHFSTTKYDYFKYNGVVKATESSFDKRNDRYFFYKLSKHPDPLHFLVANVVESEKLQWIGNLTRDSESNQRYNSWLKRKESFYYLFEQDLNKLLDNFRANIRVIDGQYPPLLVQYNYKQIMIETLIVLNQQFNFFEYWSSKIDDSVMWPEQRLLLEKYQPFVSFDNNKVKKLLLARFIENNS